MQLAERDLLNAERANEFIKSNPRATRKKIADGIGIATGTLARLNTLGLIKNYPAALTTSQAGRLAKQNKRWANFRLRGSPRFEE